MKKMVPWLIASVLILFALPWLTVTIVKSDAAMAVCFILFFAVNPVYSVVLGVNAGKDMKSMWSLPLISALLFLAGTWTFFEFREIAFLLYAAIYLVLGAAAMLISVCVKKKKEQDNI